MNSNKFNHYRETQIKTASPGKLLLMLYEGAIRFLSLAQKGFESEPVDIEKIHKNIIKVQNILTELIVTLNHEKGGEIANNLKELYSFMKKQLIEANTKKEKKPCIEVKELLMELKEAWKEVVLKEEGKGNKTSTFSKNINLKG
ncbi:MAG: flagellar export chaperone FliS [Candidatus Muiribacteriota bacterium]